MGEWTNVFIGLTILLKDVEIVDLMGVRQERKAEASPDVLQESWP